MSAARGTLEVLDSHGELVTRARIGAPPMTIGRGYDCDIIVDDPYLDATHIRIVEDGDGLAAEDAGSVNGLRANGANERVARVPLARGTVLHAGRTTIKYIDPAASVAPARRDRQAAWNAPLTTRSFLSSGKARAVAMIGYLLLLIVHQSLIVFEPGIAGKIAATVLTAALLIVLWAGAWSIGAKLARHPALFSHHLAITCLVVGGCEAVMFFNDWWEFLWPRGSSAFISAPLFFGFLIVGIYSQLGLASSLRRLWRWVAAIAIPSALVALMFLIQSSDDTKFSTKMSYSAELKPIPAAHLVPAETIEAFKKDLGELRTEVDKAAKDTAKTKSKAK